MLAARAETRMSRENESEARDLIKSDCFVTEIIDCTGLGSILVSAKLPAFISNNYKMCIGLCIPIIKLFI